MIEVFLVQFQFQKSKGTMKMTKHQNLLNFVKNNSRNCVLSEDWLQFLEPHQHSSVKYLLWDKTQQDYLIP